MKFMGFTLRFVRHHPCGSGWVATRVEADGSTFELGPCPLEGLKICIEYEMW